MTQMNLCTEQKKLTDTQNRLVIAKEGVSGGGRMGSLGLADADNYHWINNKVPLRITENYVQYPMRNHNWITLLYSRIKIVN